MVALIFTFMMVLLSPRLVQAQALERDLVGLTAQYRDLIDDYRRKEDAFSISASAYYSLKTLAAQEDAVQSMRAAQIARADVIIAYLTLLQESLAQKPGVELSRKAAVDTQLSSMIDTIKQHRSRVEIATDRLTVDQEALYLMEQQRALLAVSERAQTLLKIGAVQSGLDQLVITKDKVDQAVATAPISETIRLEKQRGSDELARTIESLRGIITENLLEYDKAAERPSPSILSPTKARLQMGYRGLTTGLSFIKEISTW